MSERDAGVAETVRVPAGQIRRDASSYVDPHGFLFHHEGEIYRYIDPQAVPQYEKLLAPDTLRELRDLGLVDTAPARVVLEGLPESLVLHHQRIWPLTYCVEWCPSMLQGAAVVTLELALAAVDHDMMLQDAYPWNVLFDGSEAVFVDFTSLVPPDPEVIWPAHEQFEAFFRRPLALASQGRGDVARSLLYNNITGIDLDRFYRLTSGGYHLRHPGLWLANLLNRRLQKSTALKTKIRHMAARAAARLTPELRRKFLRRLLRRVRRFRFAQKGDPWAPYYDEISEEFDKEAKVRLVRELLTTLSPKTVLDLGCNTGVFSIVAAQCGAKVVSVDASEPCLEVLYHTARKDDLAVTPVLSDVLCPTPPYGFLGRQYPGLWQRAASEAVLCLGLMHHLHLSGRQSWERIVDLLDTVSRKHLIFEFVGMDDANIDHLPQRREIHYTLDTVTAAIRRKFRSVEVHESDRETRRLLLCEK